MTLSQYDPKLVKKESHHPDLKTTALILTILFSCLGVTILIVIFAMYGSMLFKSPMPIPAIDLGFLGPSRGSLSTAGDIASTTPIPSVDLGNVNGFVTSSDGLPIPGASILVYKHIALPSSADKNVGYSTSVRTEPDGSYSLGGLPSGVYKFTVTYPDSFVQTIDNYAVWPSSSSLYIFQES